MKTLTLLAAVLAASLLMTTGCSTCSCKSGRCAKPAMTCNGSCCKDAATCAQCCADAAGCAKCCKK